MGQNELRDGLADGSMRKPYERPELKVFGSLQLLTQGSVPNSNGDAGQTMMVPPTSDPRAKENIVEVGRHPWGFGLYLFDYRPEFQARNGAGRQFGVMADEVARVVPAAVSVDEAGYQRVDYARLGIQLGA